MTLRTHRITGTLLVGTMLATTALAAQHQQQQPREPGIQPDRPAHAMPHPHTAMKDIAVLHRVDDIHRKNVVNMRGENIGSIESLIIDVEQGQVPFAVLSAGGVLGVGGNLHPVPWDAFELRPLTDKLILNVTSEQFERAPRFEQDEEVRFGDERWTQEVRQFYQSTVQDRTMQPGQQLQQPTQRQPAQPQTRPGEESQYDTHIAARRMFVRSNHLIGMNVENTRGENLGTMNDIVFDLNSGEIAYGVLSFGGFLGMGKSRAAISWKSFELRGTDPGEHVLILNMTEEQLRLAPEWNQDRIPQHGDADWAHQAQPGARPQPTN